MDQKMKTLFILTIWTNYISYTYNDSIQKFRKKDIPVWKEEIWSPDRQALPVIDKEMIREIDSNNRFQDFLTTISITEPLASSTLSYDNGLTNFLRIERSLVNMTKDSGDNVRLRCEFRGHPQPYIRWYKNEAPLEEERGRIDVRYYSLENGRVGSKLKINHLDIHDTGYYKCEASNGNQLVDTTGILIVKAGRILPPVTIPNFSPGFPHFPALGGRLPDEDESGRGLCQIYRGITCSQLIRNRTVYIKSILHQSHMEEKLAAAITAVATSHEISTECHKFIIPLLCYFAFPLCDDNIPYPLPRKVCRHECEILLHSGSCGLKNVHRNPLVSKYDVLPVCEELPPIGSDGSSNCISLGLPDSVEITSDHTCYSGSGIDYRGTVTYTTSGLSCQQWNSKLFKVTDYPELVGGHSYCRNPGGMEVQPWCFTNDPVHHKEFCSIPKCVDYLWLYILIPIITFLILVGLFLGLWCIRQKKQPSSPSIKLTPNKNKSSTFHDHHSSQQQMEMNSFLKSQVQLPEIPLTSLRFLRVLGEGSYGKSYQGEIIGTSSTPVFIKSLREDASTKLQQEFQKEAETFKDIHHSNVMCIIGVCTKEEPLCLLFEYCFRIDLREYLIHHSPRSEIIGESKRNPDTLDLSEMLHICKQISSAMEYLSGRHFVHRDLAARNCLIGDNLAIKLCDFGTWRDIYTSDYYPVLSERPVPVRWMPPESIVYGKFTTESDIWSYGVLLWEIFSFGMQPYFGYSNQEVVDMICSHQLLSCPEECPTPIYGLIVECWHEIPSHRPTFKELNARLNSWPSVYIRTPSLCHSISTHNGSSTGPSNNTASTNISCTTAAICTSPFSVRTSSINPSLFCHQVSTNGQWKSVQI